MSGMLGWNWFSFICGTSVGACFSFVVAGIFADRRRCKEKRQEHTEIVSDYINHIADRD